MNAALFGGLCAIGLGSADFMGRFSSRAIGPHNALLGMLLSSTLLVSLWIWASDALIVQDTSGIWLVVVNGAATTVMTLLLYWGLARGPVSLVAPIVAAHPVLVLLFYFIVGGVRPGLIAWAAMAVTIIGVATWDVIQRSVIRNEVEIGIAPVTLRTPDLRYEILFQEIYRPYVGRSHPLYAKTVAWPADLAGYPFILTGADEPEPQTRFRQRYGLGIHIAGLSEHLEEARRLTVLGVGVCFLPVSFAARDVADGKLLPVLETGNDPLSDIFVISNPKAPNYGARTLALDYLRRFRS